MKEVFWVEPERIGGRCGPQLVPWDCRELRSGGIRAIASLAEPVDEQEVQAAEIEHLPLYFPGMLLVSDQDFALFLSFVPPLLDFAEQTADQGRPLLVHCTYGCDRTGAMLAIYLVSREGLCAGDAIARVRSVRPSAMTAVGYEEAVHRFAASLSQD